MLAVITPGGTSLIDPISFKHSSPAFPISLECSTSSWSLNNSQLYLAISSSIKRYTPSECLLEELYCGTDTVTCLTVNDKSNTLFFASANRVWSLDCAQSPGKLLSLLEPHNNTVTRITMSNDGTLLASVSASTVFVHHLMLSSHVQLKGLPDGKPITCCLFHQHSRTRLLLGVGRDVFVYDSTRHSGPLKTVRVPGAGEVMGMAVSPFSKTLVAAVTSNGDVALVDLDKGNGILKTVSVKTSLTCCAFTAEGAAIYLGTKSGKLLILDLRLLEKEPKSFTIGDGRAPIKAIDVQGKSKSHVSDTTNTKVKSSSSAVARLSPRHPAPSIRTASTSYIVGPGVKSPVRVTVASKIRGGGGVTPKKKLFSPVRTPLSETRNLGLDAQLAASRSPNLSRRMRPLRLRRSQEQEENGETQAQQPLPSTSHGLTEPTNARRQTKPSSYHEGGQDVEHLGLGSAPESISGHLAAIRVRSGPPSDSGPRDEDNRPKTTTRRVVSESVESAPLGRKLRTISISSTQSRVSSSKSASDVLRTQKKQERRSTTPDNNDDRVDLSSPELPREPVTPISLGKKAGKAPLVSATSSGVLGLISPEVARRAKGEGEKGKGKERVVEVKKTRFAQYGDAKAPSEGGRESADEGSFADEGQDEERQELSLQVSPRRPTAPPAWLQSPHRPSGANLNMNAAAQEFLRGIVHDVMYDFQRETKADMMNLHLDLVRMGRGWKQELREIMEEWRGEIRELKAENRRLKEENERLRRGY